jgi:hypothetical protein
MLRLSTASVGPPGSVLVAVICRRKARNAESFPLLVATVQSLTTTRTRLRFSDRANGVLGLPSRWEATRIAG